jgi:hypothetical protein
VVSPVWKPRPGAPGDTPAGHVILEQASWMLQKK